MSKIKITEDDVRRAAKILTKYKEQRTSLTNRIISNEKWYKRRHWEEIDSEKEPKKRPRPTSGYLFNVIANKHADAMDNYPECSVLPREESDTETARILTDIIPVVLEHNYFDRVYSDLWHTKLRQGTGIYGVFWDSAKDNGVGDISIKNVDVLNFYFEAGIKDIQDSKNIFVTSLVDTEDLKKAYKKLADNITSNASNSLEYSQYVYDDNIDTSDKSVVVDWYYKKREGSVCKLHFAKFVGETLLFATENEEGYENGLYDHGKYPFVLDIMYPVEGTPYGLGFVDLCKSSQEYIDKMDQMIIENAYRVGKPRWFVNETLGVNVDDFADWDKEFLKINGRPEEHIYKLETQGLDSLVLTAREMKENELKETSGNNDWSQGGTASGVTAASAIAALQEAGSKTSRDIIKNAYAAYSEVITFVIELMRQFYNEARYFRVINNNETEFVEFDNSSIAVQTASDEADNNIFNAESIKIRKPVFDVQVVPQKKSPFNRVAQNELAKELFSMGLFAAQNADQALAMLDMMDFDGKAQIVDNISRNAVLAQKAQAYDELMMQLQGLSMQQSSPDMNIKPASGNSDLMTASQLGSGLTDRARNRAINQANPDIT